MPAYEDWLRQVFGAKETRAATSFWAVHQHDALVARWVAVMGRDRVTAVMVDECDHGRLLRVFEGLLGLREGTLAPDRDLSNRSMTVSEVEAVRAFNVAAKQAGISRAVHAKTMRFGSAIHMKQRVPDPSEARIETPQWALDAACDRDRTIVPAIEAQGIRIVGDISSLHAPLASRSDPGSAPEAVLVPPRVAAEMALGMLIASGAAHDDRAGGVWVEPIEVARVSTSQLLYVVVRRSGALIASGLGSVVGRVRRRSGE